MLTPVRMNDWSTQFSHVVVTTVICVVSMGALLFLSTAGYNLGLAPVLFCAGTLGAVANNYKRFLQIPSSDRKASPLLQSKLITVQIYLSPLIGGVFAIVLYAAFMSGILSGVLFPRFPSLDEKYTDVTTFLMTTTPERNLDAAKALLWSFLAGFSERFVPNILDKVIADSAERETTDS